MKIVSFKICPFVQRVTAMLEAKGLDYDIAYISLKDKPQWFLEASPHGQVPILITDGGETLFESDAIMEYLDEIAPPLQPELSPEQRALDRAWSYMAAKNYLAQCSTMRSADSDTFTQRLETLKGIFAKAEHALTGPYFNGDELSNVDIAWLVLLHRAHIVKVHSGHDLLAGFPKVQAWQASLQALPITWASVSTDFEQLFCDFYVSEHTFIGSPNSPQTQSDDKCASSCC
ncbi:MAG: glutathione S-transferase family protein [Pseudomonadales bacterium]